MLMCDLKIFRLSSWQCSSIFWLTPIFHSISSSRNRNIPSHWRVELKGAGPSEQTLVVSLSRNPLFSDSNKCLQFGRWPCIQPILPQCSNVASYENVWLAFASGIGVVFWTFPYCGYKTCLSITIIVKQIVCCFSLFWYVSLSCLRRYFTDLHVCVCGGYFQAILKHVWL